MGGGKQVSIGGTQWGYTVGYTVRVLESTVGVWGYTVGVDSGIHSGVGLNSGSTVGLHSGVTADG